MKKTSEKKKSEKQIQTEIMTKLKYTFPHISIFRNNVGEAVYGDTHVPYGLRKGASDIIGWHTIEITPDMVGKKAAIFTAIEVKNKTRRPTEDQVIFINNVKNGGGISGIARSVDDAVKLIKEWNNDE